MDIASYIYGTLTSLTAAVIWWYGAKKRRGYTNRKVKELEYEKDRIRVFASNPAELYRESLAGLFFLLLIVSFANIARLLHGLMFDGGVVLPQVVVEGGLWCLVGSLAIRYKKRIDGVYDVKATVAKLDEQIAKAKQDE